MAVKPSPGTFPALHNYSLQGRSEFAPPDVDRRLGSLVQDPGWIYAASGLFLSPTLFDDPRQARDYLSLTYVPSAVHAWTAPLSAWARDAPRFILRDAFGNEDRFNRVWPAFGHDGGGLETVLIQGTLPEPVFFGLDGGATDHWHGDTPLTRIPGEEQYVAVRELAEMFRETEGVSSYREDEAVVSVKIVPPDGLVLDHGSPDGSGRHWTVSIGFNQADTRLSLKFWGGLWEDTVGNRTRAILFDDSVRKYLHGATKDSIFQEERRDSFREKFEEAIIELAEARPVIAAIAGPLRELRLPPPFFHGTHALV